jgi:hypothetical protein
LLAGIDSDVVFAWTFVFDGRVDVVIEMYYSLNICKNRSRVNRIHIFLLAFSPKDVVDIILYTGNSFCRDIYRAKLCHTLRGIDIHGEYICSIIMRRIITRIQYLAHCGETRWL